MAKFKFKVAYTTNPDNIESALSAGTIDEGDLVIVNQNGKGSLRFITKEREILSFSTVDEVHLETTVTEKVQETVTQAVDEALSWAEPR